MNASVAPLAPEAWLPPEFAVNSLPLDRGLILSVEGELDRLTVDDVRREAETQSEHSGGPLRPGGLLVLDLSRTTFMDTSGLHLIHNLHDGRGPLPAVKLVLIVGTRRVARILELAPPPDPVTVITIDDPTPAQEDPRRRAAGMAALAPVTDIRRRAPRGHALGARAGDSGGTSTARTGGAG